MMAKNYMADIAQMLGFQKHEVFQIVTIDQEGGELIDTVCITDEGLEVMSTFGCAPTLENDTLLGILLGHHEVRRCE